MARRSQRSIITPEHFIVAPEILGLPLASPSRRAFAMGIDLLLVGILVKAGSLFLALVAAVLLFRASAPEKRTGFLTSSVRTSLRIAGAILLFVVVLKAWEIIKDRAERAEGKKNDKQVQVTPHANGELNLNLAPRQVASLAGTLVTLHQSKDSTEIATAAKKLLTVARDGGADRDELVDTRDDIIDMIGDNPAPKLVQAVDGAIAEIAGPAPRAVAPDSAFARYLQAVARKDSAAAQAYRDSARMLVAGSDIAKLETRANRADARADSLRHELAEAHKARGLRSFVAGIADDIGVGFGWMAVYFTAFLTLWRGQTPGKRLAGVRVMLLDGKPLGWWMSFERFGGYAASFSVGLMGFLQILWDRNRQGLHDKACETVVVRVNAAAKPALPARRF